MGGLRLGRMLRRMREAWIDYPMREGRTLQNRYRIIRHIGTGSYGSAYEGLDLRAKRRVLLKTNKPSKGAIGVQLLRRESEVMRQLCHPQIPDWIDYARLGRTEWLVTGLMEGRNLEEAVIEEQLPIGERGALAIARSLVGPLAHLHEAGFVHRDVRIPNVIMHEGAVSLVDFGLACGIGERLPEELRKGLGELPGGGQSADAGRSAAAARGRFGTSPKLDESADVWHSVKRRMREPSVTSDLYGVGHLLLFLLYSGFEAPGDRVRSWQEELPLSVGTRELITRLLEGGAEGFRNAQELGDAIDRLLAAADGS